MDAARNQVLSSVLGSAGSMVGQGIAQMGGAKAPPATGGLGGTGVGSMPGKEI